MVGPDHLTGAFRWRRFFASGMATHTGRLNALAALAQMLMFPLLLVVWTLVVVIIAMLA